MLVGIYVSKTYFKAQTYINVLNELVFVLLMLVSLGFTNQRCCLYRVISQALPICPVH